MAISLLPIGYAVYVLASRKQGKDENFRKLGPMKEKYGERHGSMLHYLGYCVAPLAFGLIILYAGIKGLNITDII